jgi:four helix bundle protein
MSGRQQAAGRNYRELEVFRLADELVLRVYDATRMFPQSEAFGLTSQIRRAAVSVPSNIIEGAGRQTDAEFARFLDIAHGSCDELAYQLSLALRLNYIGASAELVQQAERVSRMLSGLIRACRLPPAAASGGRS